MLKHKMKFGTATSLAVAILCILVRKSSAKDCELDAICYALDQSGSVDDNEYEEVKNFTITSSRLFLQGSLTSYSAVAFSSSKQTIQPPTQNLEGEFVPAISAERIFKGGTNIYSGLEACYDILVANSNPGKVLVLVTDGHGHNGTSPVDKIKAEQISIVSIGVGSGVNQQFLLQLASSPSFYLPTSAFNLLPSFAQTVASAVCAAVSTPTATATPSTTPSISASVASSASPMSSTTPIPSVSTSTSPTASSSMTPSSSASMTPSASASVSPVPSMSNSPPPIPEETAMAETPSMEPSPEEITTSNPVQTIDVLQETEAPSSSPTSPFFYVPTQAGTCQDSCLNAIEECRSMIQGACKS